MSEDQQRIINEVIELGLYLNNYLDDDVVQDAINQLKKATTKQEAYESILLLIASMEFRTGKYAKLLFVKKEKFECLLRLKNMFVLTISTAEHIKHNNTEALKHLELAAQNGFPIRLT